MKITNILLLCCLFSLASPAATVSVITPTRTSLTNATLPQATGGYQLGATAIGVSGLTNLTLPGYITLGNTTNRISDDGSNLTRNGTAIGTGGGGDTLWHDVASAATLTNTMESMFFSHDVSAGDDPDVNFDLFAVMDGVTFNDFGDIYMVVSTNNAQLNVVTTANNTDSGIRLISGDSLFEILGIVDGANEFRVVSPSGYTGAGTLFLSDDGTYKTAGGGGDTIWTNVSGTIQPLSGQTTNRLSFTSGAADNATNALFVVDSANYLAANGTKLVEISNAGTNNFVVSRNGGLTIGRGSLGWWGGLSEGGETLVSVRDAALGEPNFNDVFTGVVNVGSDIGYWEALQTALTSSFEAKVDAGAGTSRITGEVTPTSSRLRLITGAGGTRVDLNPAVASSGSAVAHFVDTSNVLTNGDSLFQVRNQGVVGLDVTAAGAITGRLPVDYGFALSDETSALTTTTNAVRWRAPHAFTLTGVRASLTTTQSSGSIATFDLKKNGTSVLSTLVTIDNGETTSVTAAAPPVISTTAFADDDIMVISITQVGTGGTGAKFTIKCYR